MQRAFFPVAAASFTMATLLGGAAWAAPPPNDDIADAIAFSTLPFSDMEDTTEATNGPEDSGCEGGATVWYRFTPSVTQSVLVSSAGSDYESFVSVYSGSPGALTGIVCGTLEKTLFDATAGTTYFLAVSAPSGLPGGNLVFAVEPSPFAFTLSPTGTFDSRTGAATVRATLTCQEPALLLFGGAQMTQRVGRQIIHGFGDLAPSGTCDATHPFVATATITGENGAYRGGKVDVFADLTFFFGGFTFGTVEAHGGVTLSGR